MEPQIQPKVRPTRSEARKLYWSTVSKEERSKRGRKAATIKAKNMTIEQRRAHAMIMVAGRNKKV